MRRDLLALLLFFSLPAWGQGYTDAMYRRALEDNTTRPLYVLISLHDDATGSEREVCVSAPFLLGAVHLEYELGYDEADIQKALEIAMSQPGRVFSFNERARANFPPLYSVEAVAAVRQRLESMSDQELREQLSDFRSFLGAMQNTVLLEYRHQNGPGPTYREPLAHVLLERGILVGRGDLVGNLYVADE